MQPKKNPKADLNKNRNLYFVIGLTLVTFITWQAIESKTYEKTFDYEALNVEAVSYTHLTLPTNREV